ncbi:LlaJI family restriction endonuclease [Campylobacter ureolyticus]|uniref:LlaJI family restriction endonuclease n=1 Tax=Campylobacter ureolyticus TaxID=827 RepID=UPI0028897087|nr:LlaJI family restriction endonuclease [Campylobacter ureolyticus]
MDIKLLKELKRYSFDKLKDIFEKDDEELRDLLKNLSLMNIVKYLKSCSKFELDELLDEDFKLNDKFDDYVFKYVGIIVVGNICLVIYPKYIEDEKSDKNYEILKQLISVIRKYQSKQQNIGFDEELELENFNLLSVVLELIHSYYEHGLYINENDIIEQNGEGEICWEKTINETTAYFSNNIPFYLDTFTLNQKSNKEDFFTLLHAFVLSEGCKKLKDILNILNISPINLSLAKLDNFGTIEFIINRLNQELSTQFITYRQNILKLLKRYIEQDSIKKTSSDISFVGTSSFNLVWEDVCSKVLDNSLEKRLEELGLCGNYGNENDGNKFLKDIIPKPKWRDVKTSSIHEATKTLIPDIVTINKDGLSIYDAKYYTTILDENEAKNTPGIGDITKQYFYKMAYEDFARKNNISIKHNAFLMPTCKSSANLLGDVSLNLPGFENSNIIDIILLPTCKMYEYYLANKTACIKIDRDEKAAILQKL